MKDVDALQEGASMSDCGTFGLHPLFMVSKRNQRKTTILGGHPKRPPPVSVQVVVLEKTGELTKESLRGVLESSGPWLVEFQRSTTNKTAVFF